MSTNGSTSVRDVDGTVGSRGPELVTDGIRPRRSAWIENLTSGDHKDVGRSFIAAAFAFGFLGVVAFLLMRLQLAVPESTLIEPVTFNRLLSVGTVSLVVLFALPLAVGLYTYILPLQIGARGTAFPRLGQFALWLYVIGGGALYVSFVYTPPEVGVLASPPLSSTDFIDNNGADVWITAVGLTTLAMVLQSVNLLVTLGKLRAPGMAWKRVPPFAFSGAVTSWVLVVAGSAMLAALVMLEIDRNFGGVFFDAGEGGEPMYYRHLAWIFFTGCWLVMLLPAIGAISEILPTFSGKPLLSRGTVAASMAALGALGLMAWMQNMFTADIPAGFLYGTMAVALALIVPIGLIFGNWLATLMGGALRMRAPMVFALAAISVISFGVLGELLHALIPVNWLLAGTSDATTETGYVLIGGTVLGGLAAVHYWFPKLTGRTAAEGPAKGAAALIFIGAHVTLMPLFFAGLEGMPADVYTYGDGNGSGAYENLGTYNLISTIGAFILAAGFVAAVANLARSATAGPKTGPDPWRADTLEWFAPSPPPPHNFDVVPDVRSDEPLRDIREAVAKRAAEGSSAPSESPDEPGQPVA